MNKERWSFLTLSSTILLILFLHSVTAFASTMVVWTDHATVKIFPTTASKPTQSSATLKAAKNEFEPFQLIVTAQQGDLAGVDVNVSDLMDIHGNILPSSAIMIYKEAFIDISTLSTIQGTTGRTPDALIPKKDEYAGEIRNAFPFSVPTGENQPIWIEIYVPITAEAGDYRGSATVTATGQNPIVVPIQLTVWNFSLPSISTLKSAYSINYHYIPLGHGLPAYSGTPAEIKLIQLYAKANLLHRLTDSYLPGPHALGGLANGVVRNWVPFDNAFGPFLDGTVTLPGGKLPGNKMTTYQMETYAHQTDVPFMRDYAQHFRAKGWFDRLFQYTCDEPPNGCSWNTIKTYTDALHLADPQLRSLVTASIQSATAAGMETSIDLFSPTIRFMDNKTNANVAGGEVPGGFGTVGNQRGKYGPEVWWYQACGSHGCGIIGGSAHDDPTRYHTDWPSTMIDLPAMFSRVMEWQSFKYNIQGELYFDMVYAYGNGSACQGNPWVDQRCFGGNGDGTLYYPGAPSKIGGSVHIPIESIRLKLIREGQEDYEYMTLLKGLGEEAYAKEQVGRIVTNTYTWSRNPLDLYDAREKMAERIIAKSGNGTLPPVIPPAPQPADPVLPPVPSPVSFAPAPDPGIPAPTPDPVSPAAAPITTSSALAPTPTSSALAPNLSSEQSQPAAAAKGGCVMIKTIGPIDFRQAFSYLLIFFSPFIRRFWRKMKSAPIRRRLNTR